MSHRVESHTVSSIAASVHELSDKARDDEVFFAETGVYESTNSVWRRMSLYALCSRRRVAEDRRKRLSTVCNCWQHLPRISIAVAYEQDEMVFGRCC